jgi:hypothetical protein
MMPTIERIGHLRTRGAVLGTLAAEGALPES